MKRIVLWLMSTLTVLVLLFGYHTSTSSKAAAGGTTSISTPFTGGATTGGAAATGPGGAAASSSSPAGSPSSAPAAGPASAGAAASTVTGSVVETRWGPVQVQLTVAARKITKVAVVQYPDGNGRDQEINAYALPILIQETLKQQNANIDMISGATYTSDGYQRSLQSALDKAGI